MFEDLRQELNEKTGFRLSEPAIAYLHYGAIHGSLFLIGERTGEPRSVSQGAIQDRASEQISELGAVGLTPEKEDPDPDLVALLPLLAGLAGASLNEEAAIYVNQIIKASSRAVLLRAPKLALDTHPQIPTVAPVELSAACAQVFENKIWFLC